MATTRKMAGKLIRLIRMTNANGRVATPALTTGTSSGVRLTNLTVKTQFVVPANAPAGVYLLVAVANGNASPPVTFTFPPHPAIVGASIAGSNFVVTASGGLPGRKYRLVASGTGPGLLSETGRPWPPI